MQGKLDLEVAPRTTKQAGGDPEASFHIARLINLGCSYAPQSSLGSTLSGSSRLKILLCTLELMIRAFVFQARMLFSVLS